MLRYRLTKAADKGVENALAVGLVRDERPRRIRFYHEKPVSSAGYSWYVFQW